MVALQCTGQPFLAGVSAYDGDGIMKHGKTSFRSINQYMAVGGIGETD